MFAGYRVVVCLSQSSGDAHSQRLALRLEKRLEKWIYIRLFFRYNSSTDAQKGFIHVSPDHQPVWPTTN